MSGNKLGDRFHNFFVKNNSLHPPQGAEGNWAVLNNDIWAGSQNILNSNNKNYNNSQGPDIDRGQSSFPFHVTHGLDVTQSNLRPERSNLNGYMYESQFHHTRQNEANCFPVDSDSYQPHQGGGPPELQANSVPSGSFDLFGSQHQMSHQQVNDMQQLQQQLMIRKMQELHQRQEQQIRQIDLRQQNQINQVNGPSNNADYPWTPEVNRNWTNRGSSPNGYAFSPNLGPQNVNDQSLYGVPVSSSRGLNVNQMSNFSYSLQGKYQIENMSGHGVNNTRSPNSVQNNAPRDFFGRQELSLQPETPNEIPRNEVTLDPTEEKILFGSDDNLWTNSFDKCELNDGFTSLQSGSWSALMQSAVGETSSGDIEPHEGLSGLFFDGQPSAIQNDNIKHLPSNNGSTNNVMGFDLLGHKYQNEPGQKFVPSLEEGSKGSQTYKNATQLSLEPEKKASKISPPWDDGQNENMQQQSNGWNSRVGIPPGGERVSNILESEKASHDSQSNQMMVMQGKGVYENSIRKPNSISNSPMESSPIKSTVGNPEANKRMIMSNETSPFVQNNYLLNQWKNANHSSKSHQLIEHNRGLDLLNENCDLKENSNDSHCSNLSHHTTGGVREKESTTQLARKVSVPRKFQYHPMGKFDEHLESSYSPNQPTHVRDVSQQNSSVGQSKLLVQVPRNPIVTEKGQASELQNDDITPDKEQMNGGFPGHAQIISMPLTGPFYSYTSNKSSLYSQDKVDQSSDPEPKRRSSPSQSFVLQLGPPSSSPFQKSQSPNNSIQSFPFPNGGTNGEFENKITAGQPDVVNKNSMYNKNGIFRSPFSSSTQQITRVSGNVTMNQHIGSSSNSNTLNFLRSEISVRNASGNIQHDNFASSGQKTGPNDEREELIRDQVLTSMLTNKGAGDFPSELSSFYMNSSSVVDKEEQNLKERSGNIDPPPKMKEPSLGKTFSIENSSGNSASPDKDIEAFGRSLKPNNQTEALKDEETDPGIRLSKRTKSTDFKFGQMLNIYEANEITSLRSEKAPFTLGDSSSVPDAINFEENVSDALVSNGHLSYPHSSLVVSDQHLVILRSKKRKKSPSSERQPWHKEILGGSLCVWTISVAESDWSKAANRLPKKVKDDAEFIKDGPLVLRSERRLILTTQLMQQIFRPPPVDASSKYDSVIYAVSKVALGDSCSTISRSSDSMDLHSGEGKPSEEAKGDQKFGKILKELLDRARNLENDFLRLDKNASILDLRLGCQDLERFSVLNRFAICHGRGQNENLEAADIGPTQKPIPQRYVTALPMPRTLSDRVQCLSL